MILPLRWLRSTSPRDEMVKWWGLMDLKVSPIHPPLLFTCQVRHWRNPNFASSIILFRRDRFQFPLKVVFCPVDAILVHPVPDIKWDGLIGWDCTIRNLPLFLFLPVIDILPVGHSCRRSCSHIVGGYFNSRGGFFFLSRRGKTPHLLIKRTSDSESLQVFYSRY